MGTCGLLHQWGANTVWRRVITFFFELNRHYMHILCNAQNLPAYLYCHYLIGNLIRKCYFHADKMSFVLYHMN